MTSTPGRPRRIRRWTIAAAIAVLAVVAAALTWSRMTGPRVADHRAEPPIPVSEETAAWADTLFGTFEASTWSGAGDQLLDFPEELGGVSAMLVTVAFEGSGQFTVREVYGVDGRSKTHPANAGEVGEDSVRSRRLVEPRTGDWAESGLELTGDGEWTVTFEPVSGAGSLSAPIFGRGNDVLIREGPAADVEFEHFGERSCYLMLGAWGSPDDRTDKGWANSAEVALFGSGAEDPVREAVAVPAGPVLILVSGDEWKLGEDTGGR